MKTQDNTEFFTLTAEDELTQATVSLNGGFCTSMMMPSSTGLHELIYFPQSNSQNQLREKIGGLNFCFPNCGQLQRNNYYGAYFFSDKIYELPKHGLAWHLPWNILQRRSDQIFLTLQDNDFTRLHYPFEFIIELDYIVKPKVIQCRATITNRGEEAMPYYAGFNTHLSIQNWLTRLSDMVLYYEPDCFLEYDLESLDILGETSRWEMPISLKDLSGHEILTKLGENNQICLYYPDKNRLYLEMQGIGINRMFPYLQVSMLNDEKPYIGLQSWMSYPNALNSVQGVRWLAPHQSEQALIRFSYELSS